MAVNDKERRKALERSYPGKVQEDTTGRLYVDDAGTRRRPKGLLETPTGAMSSIAGGIAPTVGAGVGEAVGAGVGAGFGAGVGALPGGVAGSAAGGAAGQGFNDVILQLAGVYDRSGGEEAGNLALAGGFAGAGSAAGRSIGGVIGSAGGVKQAIKQGAGSGAVGKFLGADAEGLETAIGLRRARRPRASVRVDEGSAANIQNVVEVFDPAFHTFRNRCSSRLRNITKKQARVYWIRSASKNRARWRTPRKPSRRKKPVKRCSNERCENLRRRTPNCGAC